MNKGFRVGAMGIVPECPFSVCEARAAERQCAMLKFIIAVLFAFAAGRAHAGTWKYVEGWVISGCPKAGGGQCVEQGALPWPTYGDCNAALTAQLRASNPAAVLSCKFVSRQQFFQ